MSSLISSILTCARPSATFNDYLIGSQESREECSMGIDPPLPENEAMLIVANLYRKSDICLLWMEECVEAGDLSHTIDLAKKIAKARDTSRELAEKFPALEEADLVLEEMNLKGWESVDKARSLLLKKSTYSMLECRAQSSSRPLHSCGKVRGDPRMSASTRKRSRSA